MLGDVLLIKDHHKTAAEAILKRVLNDRKGSEKYIIGISGESGSGKTELAHVLAKLLKDKGIRTKPIHIDNYYRIPPLERTEWRKANGIAKSVGYNEYDWEAIYRNLEEFRQGKMSQMPCIDIVTEQVDRLITDFSEIEIIIVDGLYAIHTEGLNLGVFIELTYHETKKAQADRGKEPQNEYRWQVLEQEHKVVQSLRDHAQIFINKNYEVY